MFWDHQTRANRYILAMYLNLREVSTYLIASKQSHSSDALVPQFESSILFDERVTHASHSHAAMHYRLCRVLFAMKCGDITRSGGEDDMEGGRGGERGLEA
jgi:hypothetical protein